MLRIALHKLSYRITSASLIDYKWFRHLTRNILFFSMFFKFFNIKTVIIVVRSNFPKIPYKTPKRTGGGVLLYKYSKFRPINGKTPEMPGKGVNIRHSYTQSSIGTHIYNNYGKTDRQPYHVATDVRRVHAAIGVRFD